MLIAENTRWDDFGKFEEIADRYLSFCDDEKPVTVRQCIQGLTKIIPYKKSCLTAIADRLIAINLMRRKETQRKILLMDILSVLVPINRLRHDERISRYLQTAMTGGILDNKAKRLVESFKAGILCSVLKVYFATASVTHSEIREDTERY